MVDLYTMVVTKSSWCWSAQLNFIKGLIFNWTVFEIIMNLSSPNSFRNLFSDFSFEKLMLSFRSSCFWLGYFYINAHFRKFWTEAVTIFKLLCIFSLSTSSQKLLHLWRLMYQNKYRKKVSLVDVIQIF